MDSIFNGRSPKPKDSNIPPTPRNGAASLTQCALERSVTGKFDDGNHIREILSGDYVAIPELAARTVTYKGTGVHPNVTFTLSGISLSHFDRTFSVIVFPVAAIFKRRTFESLVNGGRTSARTADGSLVAGTLRRLQDGTLCWVATPLLVNESKSTPFSTMALVVTLENGASRENPLACMVTSGSIMSTSEEVRKGFVLSSELSLTLGESNRVVNAALGFLDGGPKDDSNIFFCNKTDTCFRYPLNRNQFRQETKRGRKPCQTDARSADPENCSAKSLRPLASQKEASSKRSKGHAKALSQGSFIDISTADSKRMKTTETPQQLQLPFAFPAHWTAVQEKGRAREKALEEENRALGLELAERRGREKETATHAEMIANAAILEAKLEASNKANEEARCSSSVLLRVIEDKSSEVKGLLEKQLELSHSSSASHQNSLMHAQQMAYNYSLASNDHQLLPQPQATRASLPSGRGTDKKAEFVDFLQSCSMGGLLEVLWEYGIQSPDVLAYLSEEEYREMNIKKFQQGVLEAAIAKRARGD